MKVPVPSLAFLGVLLAALVLIVVASRSGWGLPRPAPQPVSIREGSARSGNAGYRPRYFTGGGFRGGK